MPFYKRFGCVCLLVLFISLFYQKNAETVEENSKTYYNNIVDTVNNGDNLWQAGYNFDAEKLPSLYKFLVGSMTEDEDQLEYNNSNNENDEDDDNDEDENSDQNSNDESDESDDSDESDESDDSNDSDDSDENGYTEYGEKLTKCEHSESNEGNVKRSSLIGASDERFDSRVRWKQCPTINRIWDQGACSSDWVIAAVSAIADRLCIASNGTFNKSISPIRPLSCCKTCGWGCRKGYLTEVWNYWAQKGLVTGGPFKSKEGCQPYSIRPGNSSSTRVITPRCRKRCYNRKYNKKYKDDIIKGKRHVRELTCPYCAAGEIKRHGPITTTFAVFEDFLFYKSGIYHHVAGKRIGSLSVRVVGWDLDKNNVSYWIAANSWGKNWGENGFFKIRRKFDDVTFESRFRMGYPKSTRRKKH